MTVVVCRPDSIAIRRIIHCPTCEQRRRFAAFDQFWYGPTWTCLGCGDSWSDGYRMERPFRRAWRVQARTRAAGLWADGVRAFSAEHRAWLEHQMDLYLNPTDRAACTPLSESAARGAAGDAAVSPVDGGGAPATHPAPGVPAPGAEGPSMPAECPRTPGVDGHPTAADTREVRR